MQRFVDLLVMVFLLCLMPVPAAAQIKSIVIGEGVRGATYMPAYIAEEKGYFKKKELIRKL